MKSLVGENLFSRYDRLLLQKTLDSMPGLFHYFEVKLSRNTLPLFTRVTYFLLRLSVEVKKLCTVREPFENVFRSFALLLPVSLRCGVLSPASLWRGCHSGDVQQGGNVLCVCLCLLRHLSKDLPWSRRVPRRERHTETETRTNGQHATRRPRPATVARYTSVLITLIPRKLGGGGGVVGSL